MTELLPSRNPLDERFDLLEGQVQLTGLQALVRLPMDLHRRDVRNGLDTGVAISGYEGSPLAGFDLQLNRQTQRLADHRIVFQPSVNEELAANVIQGSQLASASPDRIGDGVIGIWYGKAPGFDRATDALRHANLGGADHRGGVLALVGDDSIAKSSTVPSSSEMAIAEVGMPCLSPADPQDILDLGVHGIAMSRCTGSWVAMKLATNVVDGSGGVALDPDRVQPQQPDLTFDGEPFQHQVSANFLQPNLTALERSQTTKRLELARRYAAANELNSITGDPSATLGVVAAGATYLDVRQALEELGITDANLSSSGVRLLKLGMVHPLEPGVVNRFAEGLSEIVVVEEKRSFIEMALKDLLYGRVPAPKILGKQDASGQELFRADSDIPAPLIAQKLAPLIAEHGGPSSVTAWLASQQTKRPMPTLLPILPRKPFFCSGCPHNSSTVVPNGAVVGSGIGCHGMVAFLPPDRVGTSIGFTQMGGEGASWIGMSPFVSTEHAFQNLGDGTYHHSGSLAVRAAIASGVNITYKLLYNDAVAMTGGQQAVGKMSVAEIASELLAEGVTRVVITTDDVKRYRKSLFKSRRLPNGVKVRHRDEIVAVQEELARVPGVTVLIHDQECATELRRKRKRGLVETPTQRILINERVCEGCGDCGEKSNCLSVLPVDTEFGRKTRIHQASCNLDYSCVKGDCPSFVSVTPAKGRGKSGTGDTAPGPATHTPDLPLPVRVVDADNFSMRITGIGGTGVVTLSQVLAAAAKHAGLHVKGLDQLGLAQKGGAVVSDIRLSRTEIAGGNKIGPSGCDLYLGCDILVAGAPDNLAVMAEGRTFAVVSTSVSPTGDMVTDPNLDFPDPAELVARIEWAGAHPENVFIDARAAVLDALKDDQYANVFLLGAAVQAGVLPIEPEHLEWALDLNGVQVQRNLDAFRLGRRYVADGRTAPEERAATAALDPRATGIAARVKTPAGSELAEIVSRRVRELIDYQNPVYAQRYVDAVESMRGIEQENLGASTAITTAFARQLHKVMAYKDEYEVARLSLDPELERQVKEQFGPGATYSFMLHPPVLRAMGMKNKIKLGPWSRPLLKVLRSMKSLRGTRLDVFGYANVRVEERALIEDYLSTMDAAAARLDDSTAKLVHELAELPDIVRGYEDVKLKSLERYRARRDELMQLLEAAVDSVHP